MVLSSRAHSEVRLRTATPAQGHFFTLTEWWYRHRQTAATKLYRDLAAASGIRTSRQTIHAPSREGPFCACGTLRRKHTTVCSPSEHISYTRKLVRRGAEHTAHKECVFVWFTDESRFSTQSDSRQVFIWRKPIAHCHTSNVRECNHFGGRGILVWDGIMLGSPTRLHVFDLDSLTPEAL